MTDQHVFLDQPLFLSSGKSLVMQVHDILRREIHAGRWRIGDRLPGISTLAEASGLSRAPIQQAFERLRKEGYVRQDSARGTFLASLEPEGRTPFGAIGLVLDVSLTSASEGIREHAYRVRQFSQAATHHNYTLEVIYINDPAELNDLLSRGGRDDRRLEGMIVFPIPPENTILEFQGNFPTVFFGYPHLKCFPCVSGDAARGSYLLTRRLIQAGHRKIAFFTYSSTPSVRFQGYSAAMTEAGLEVDWESAETSARIRIDDLVALKRFLTEHSDSTAILCSREGIASKLIDVANLMGIRVPEDLSVVSQVALPPEESGAPKVVSGYRFDIGQLAQECMKLLMNQITTGRRAYAGIYLSPIWVEGETLAPCRSSESEGPAEQAKSPDSVKKTRSSELALQS